MSSGGRLQVVATPIGSLGDLSPRAAEALASSDFWIVEDTRVSGKLASHLGLKKPMVVANDHTPPAKIEGYVERIRKGENAALLTDGGTPVISDPGTELVDLCHEHGLKVEPIPGPSAVMAALSVSGFYGQRFAFLGFLGKKPGDASKTLAPFADSPLTLVLFESPHRILKTLEVCATVLGSRRFALCKEMTKIHESVTTGELGSPESLLGFVAKGELTLVIEGRRKK